MALPPIGPFVAARRGRGSAAGRLPVHAPAPEPDDPKGRAWHDVAAVCAGMLVGVLPVAAAAALVLRH